MCCNYCMPCAMPVRRSETHRQRSAKLCSADEYYDDDNYDSDVSGHQTHNTKIIAAIRAMLLGSTTIAIDVCKSVKANKRCTGEQ
eukprot:5116785-Lingulodinium_polyedra.AAC.1